VPPELLVDPTRAEQSASSEDDRERAVLYPMFMRFWWFGARDLERD
jgi:hypothetical protein